MGKRIFLIIVSVVLIVSALPAGATPKERLDTYWPTEGWRTSTPEEQGMDSAELANLFGMISQPTFRADSAIVIRHGYVVAEAYFHPVEMSDRHHLYSASKSFTSALIGIAMDQGYIDSVDQKALDLFGGREVENMDEWKESITLRNLLTMSNGLACDGLGAIGDNGGFDGDDWVQSTLDIPMMYEPGTEFHYCNPSTMLLSALINETTGLGALKFAQKNLFGPLGITEARWTASPMGVNFGASELQLKPRDMAKFGLLYLNNGEWDGEQIVPADWVAESTAVQYRDAYPGGFHYGYQWWVAEALNMYSAIGHAGQYIWVWPEKDLIYIATSSATDATRIMHSMMPTMMTVDALTVADDALPANPDGVAQLQAVVDSIQQPTAAEVPALPEMVEMVNGQTFGLLKPDLITGGNRTTWRLPYGNADWWNTTALALAFDDTAEAKLTLVYADGAADVMPIGLDGLYRRSETRRGMLAAKGEWVDHDTFQLYLKDINDCIEYRLDMTCEADLLDVMAFDMCNGDAVAVLGVMAPPEQ